jgi:hypothetical protein
MFDRRHDFWTIFEAELQVKTRRSMFRFASFPGRFEHVIGSNVTARQRSVAFRRRYGHQPFGANFG